MWTCPKCGEAIEGQFDSCWKCSNVSREPAVPVRPPLKGSDYLITALIAYSIPVLAILLQPGFTNRFTVFWGRDLFNDAQAWLEMLLPAAINFFILLPFLRFQGLSRAVAIFLLFGWTLFILFTAAKIR
ncbi:MAG TPA: hypothetical protein VH597_01400 [Verrucomicrobiae bacterium]|jgi:hypothetical protein|nr:hypothetical protein [Verrucomicrobiae bacterium]